MHETADIAIVGGGASGLTAAIFAAQAAGHDRRVLLLDGAAQIGAKILVSGGGRCNVTHDVVVAEDFHGKQPVIRNVLSAFDASAAVRWFASMGVELKREETGKLFPVTESARTIVSALVGQCQRVGVEIRTGARVDAIAAAESGWFTVHHGPASVQARRVIVATGGRSLPRSGSDGFGWELVNRLGHTVTPTGAALVPLVLDERMFHSSLSGIAMEAELLTSVSGKRIDRRRGQLLWTHFGISGPVVMDASRHWVMADEAGAAPTMHLNVLPGEQFESAERWLVESAASRPRQSLASLIGTRLPDRFVTALATHAGIDPATRAAQLTREARRALVHNLIALSLPVVRHRGWNYAEVTAGGVPLAEVDYRTMASRKVRALYLVGEILDCDGRIGGFNFQWAWATGYLAGNAAGAGLPSLAGVE